MAHPYSQRGARPKSATGGSGGKRYRADLAAIFADLSLEHPGFDWYDAPMDRVYFLHEHLQAREARAYARAVTTGEFAIRAMSSSTDLSEVAKRGYERGTVQVYTLIDGSEVGSSSGQQYEIPASVARGLDKAMSLSLITGPLMSSWPASRDGKPLSRIWEGIVAAM
ncbi:hypothetical protein GCM10022631_11390 [Deinococcus rubellus]|uniref:hypothetical protein n=1 Tax=Deinococcus rubellus TaxID=1889240 RepID=UPI0031E8065B